MEIRNSVFNNSILSHLKFNNIHSTIEFHDTTFKNFMTLEVNPIFGKASFFGCNITNINYLNIFRRESNFINEHVIFENSKIEYHTITIYVGNSNTQNATRKLIIRKSKLYNVGFLKSFS